MKQRLGTVHTFTMSGTSQATAAFGTGTYMVRLATGAQPAFFALGSSPTAAATDNLLGTNCVDYIKVNPGEKVAVLQAGTAGTITVTELV
jgi:hypothetical protein